MCLGAINSRINSQHYMFATLLNAEEMSFSLYNMRYYVRLILKLSIDLGD